MGMWETKREIIGQKEFQGHRIWITYSDMRYTVCLLLPSGLNQQ